MIYEKSQNMEDSSDNIMMLTANKTTVQLLVNAEGAYKPIVWHIRFTTECTSHVD